MKKRLLSGLLVLVMLLAMLPVGVLAAEEEHTHIDENKNHVCDFPGCQELVHIDENLNHVCDHSDCEVTLHTDNDGNCVCDVPECTEAVHVFDGDVCVKCYFHTTHVDENGNCVCDVPQCSEEMHEFVDGVCAKCYFHTVHVDENDNCMCDLPQCTEAVHDMENGFCQNCGYHEAHVDENANCVCDVPGCEIEMHADDYEDGVCDKCQDCLHKKGADGYCTTANCAHVKCPVCGGVKPVETTQYYIIAKADRHGAVSNEGWPVYVDAGDNLTVWFYPEKGYEVSAVYVDGYLVNYYGICYDHHWNCKGCDDCWWIDWSRWYECDHHHCDDYWCNHHACYPCCDWTDWQDGITFYNVDDNHEVYVEFAPVDSGCPSAYYYDLNTEAWYHEATDFVIEKDLMKGVGGKYFDPNGKTTRGQLVTMLYRLAGEPKVSGESEFLDVADDKWYTDAVVWAAKRGIVDGYGNGYFGVYDTVTREQTVTILYRYAKYTGVSVAKLADLRYYIDVEAVSDYAEEPFGWAVKRDVIEGKPVSGGYLKLDPQGATARVEMAAMLMRFAKFVD